MNILNNYLTHGTSNSTETTFIKLEQSTTASG